MKVEINQMIIGMLNDMLNYYVCPELKAEAEKVISALNTDHIADVDALIAELREDICSIDDYIGFAQSDFCKNMKGEEEARAMLEKGLEAKANGETVCLCPGCRRAHDILNLLEHWGE